VPVATEPVTNAVQSAIVAEKPKKNTGKKILILFLIILGIAVVSVAAIGVFKMMTDKEEPEEVAILTPDRAPADEENAESMGDEGDKKLDQPEGGGAVSLTYTKDVVIDLSENKVSLLFGNPSRSNQGMVLQIIIQDKVIVQSGTLKPGVQVKELELTGNAKLQPGVYEGKFNVLYYDVNSGDKAVVNTEIPIDINVKE
jgi:hypothetical protein